MSRSNYFFDFDGTIVNSLNRMYILFCRLTNSDNLTYNQYWQIKRNGVDQKTLLTNYFGYKEERIREFRKKWFELIESDEMLSLDVLYEDAEFVLKNLSKDHDIYIVTARQFLTKAKEQINNFGIEKYIKDILVTHQKSTKFEVIKAYMPDIIQNAEIIIGDTGEDIETGKKLDIKTVAVTTGILNRETISKYSPNFICENLRDFYDNVYKKV